MPSAIVPNTAYSHHANGLFRTDIRPAINVPPIVSPSSQRPNRPRMLIATSSFLGSGGRGGRRGHPAGTPKGTARLGLYGSRECVALVYAPEFFPGRRNPG